jgi:hypothetical protein
VSAELEREERSEAARDSLKPAWFTPELAAVMSEHSQFVELCFRELAERRRLNDLQFPTLRPLVMDLAHGESIAALLEMAAQGTVPPPAECRAAVRWLLLAIADGRAAERAVLEGFPR